MKLLTYKLVNANAQRGATDDRMMAALRRSAARWNATGVVRLIPSGDMSNADIIISWHDAIWSKIATTYMPARSIKLNRKHSFGWNWLTRKFMADMDLTLTHELGHAIGLKHSDDPASIMFAAQYNRAKITEADVAALRDVWVPPTS